MAYFRKDDPIVVGVDGSPAALSAVVWAAKEAARRKASLRLVHACFVPAVRHPRRVAAPADYHAAVMEQGRHWLNHAARVARSTEPAIAPSTDLRSGVVADVLMNESKHAQLVVLGSRGLGGFEPLLVGSVANAMAAHSHCPVVVPRASTPDEAAPETGPVVVGVDGSSLSEAAAEFAFEAASARGVPLVAVHTWLDVNAPRSWHELAGTIDWDQVQLHGERVLEEGLAPWRIRYPNVEVRCAVERDRPEQALLRHSAGAQLVVVGSRGRGALVGRGLGSVSQALLHTAECPVAVARTAVA